MTAPPGTTSRVTASRVLVLAPHQDDEVLGCGGLLGQLLTDGAEVTVLFLTDGSGGVEAVADRPAYARRRQAEAAAVAGRFGFAVEQLELADGSLDQQLAELAAAYARYIGQLRPDLVLVPSPLEVTPDHRAAFAALHRLLAPVREGHELAETVAELRVLVYEVNHPFYPELLVEVAEQLPLLEEAMALYASQQERHDYLAAGLGLRRYRALSLPSEVAAAEGYVPLTTDDFRTRSPAQLVRRLGGVPELLEVREGPRLSVVVRTRNRPQLLAEALASLAETRYRRAEVVLVNDGGASPEVSEDFPLPLVRVELESSRGRAGAADAGVAAATGDHLCFLDDDDLAAPEHLAVLAELISAAGVEVAYTDAAVGLYELDGERGWRCVERRLPYSRDFDPDLLRLDNYIPFNTVVAPRRLWLEAGPFDAELPFFEDWDQLLRLARLAPFHHLPQVTCEYRHFRGGAHHVFGESPRERADFLEVKARVLAKHGGDRDPVALARAVDTLRTEAVTRGEEAASRRRQEAAARRRLDELERRAARLNGEVEALRAERERLQEAFDGTRAEVERLFQEERTLREAVADRDEHLGRTYAEIERLGGEVETQGEHLRRTYAEIERLGGLIRTMEGTRAWRAHQWWQSKVRR